MDSSNDSLDRLISETLNSIHDHALQDGLANSYRTLDNVGNKKSGATRQIRKGLYRNNSLFAVAASLLLILGLGLPALYLLQDSPSSDISKRIKSTSKVASTTTTNSDTKKEDDPSKTSDPSDVDSENVTTTTTNSSTQNTTPFYSPPSPTPTSPAVVDEYVRVSYSNTRSNDFPLDGSTITGNVYIFIPDTDTYGAIWWLDQPGVWDKNLKTRSGTKKPIDFNYRVQPEAIVPNPYDTSALSVGEHTMGIETHSISTDKYTRRTIKFYVSR